MGQWVVLYDQQQPIVSGEDVREREGTLQVSTALRVGDGKNTMKSSLILVAQLVIHFYYERSKNKDHGAQDEGEKQRRCNMAAQQFPIQRLTLRQ